MAEYRQRYPESVAVLAERLEDSLQFYSSPEMDPTYFPQVTASISPPNDHAARASLLPA